MAAKKSQNNKWLLIIFSLVLVAASFFFARRLSDKQAFTFSSEAMNFPGEPTYPKDWPKWPMYVPGCSGEAVVSNRYVDRGGTGGYSRPDALKCSDGTVISGSWLNDGVFRTKQGWDQVARVACCQQGPGCGTYQIDEGRFGEKCDARRCAQIHVGGKCSWDPKQQEEFKSKYPNWAFKDLPDSLCCFDYRSLKKMPENSVVRPRQGL